MHGLDESNHLPDESSLLLTLCVPEELSELEHLHDSQSQRAALWISLHGSTRVHFPASFLNLPQASANAYQPSATFASTPNAKMNVLTIYAAALFATVVSATCPVDKTLQANKALLTTTLDALFNKHDVSAVDKYVGATYLQHNPFVKDGPQELKDFIGSSGNTSYDISAVAAAGDLVWSHSRSFEAGSFSIVVDIFRVKDGKIVEHWDVSQPEVPASQTASGRPMFPVTQSATPASVVKGCSDTIECPSKEVLEANKALTASALDAFFNKRDASAVDKYVGSTYLQHNPTAKDDAEELKKLINSMPEGSKFELGTIVAEGDLVWTHGRYTDAPGTPASIVVDVFRVKDGKLVEHWDISQTEVTETASGRPMFPIGA
ncbi:hypothetical protein FI667_g13322, partial [Globisporangium splendens]